MKTAREVSESYWATECRRDLEGVLEHYRADAIYEGPDGIRVGHDEIRAWYEVSMREFPGLEVTIIRDFPAGDASALEFRAILVDGDGRRLEVRGVNVVEVREGRFVAVRSYEDPPRAMP